MPKPTVITSSGKINVEAWPNCCAVRRNAACSKFIIHPTW
uniref:Uncharacterized protein n=1 Tax=Anguilla anguilla TaxID=7936 RepID=A0A0E9S027_ANGAN